MKLPQLAAAPTHCLALANAAGCVAVIAIGNGVAAPDAVPLGPARVCRRFRATSHPARYSTRERSLETCGRTGVGAAESRGGSRAAVEAAMEPLHDGGRMAGERGTPATRHAYPMCISPGTPSTTGMIKSESRPAWQTVTRNSAEV